MTERRFYEEPTSDTRRSAPAVARNVAPIIAVLEEWLPARGSVLELASGTGEHVIAFARHFAQLAWQPSDANSDSIGSIAAWRDVHPSDNLAAPFALDARDAVWPVAHADAIVSINMVHISPWAAALGLLDGAARLLGAGAPLILYGPWIERNVATAPSNLAFDGELRARDPEWGLRDVDAFAAAANERGLTLVERRAMPAHNLMLLLRRS
ncbi:MAG: class I SAM-dependent methyltransferase [Sphingomonas bacterium]|nr:class I SAM-dependent methyltransferase [Sphingomonas bacterium]